MGRGRSGGGGGGGGGELHAAARSGDLNAVQSFLSSNPLAVNSRDKHSRTPLHLAAWSGHAHVVNYLCQHKADVGAAAMDDMGAIHFAAQKGHLEIVRSLLSSGVSVKASTRKGLTPLHYAAQGCNLDLVKYLVKKGASLTVTTKAGKTPLDLASSEEIRVFLEKSEQSSEKGNVNAKDKAEESNSKPSLPDKSEIADGEALQAPTSEDAEEQDDERVKRKGEEGTENEASAERKRRKITLNHLLSADDTQEDENM